MDDLNGLDWTAGSSTTNKQPAIGTGNYYTSMRPNPPPATSGTSTPLSTQVSGFSKPQIPGVSKPSTPANDSFSNLVNFGSSKSGNKLSLQEQQQRLQEEKLRKAEEQKKQLDAQFGNSQFWDGLGQGTQQPASIPTPSSRTATPLTPHSQNPFSSPKPSLLGNGTSISSPDEDLFAAFNADTKVDNSSHYPPPPIPSNRNTPDLQKSSAIDLSNPSTWEAAGAASASPAEFGDDDDPFGLGQMAAKKPMNSVAPEPIPDDDDDFLGDLGKPVEEVKRRTPVPQAPSPVVEEGHISSEDPFDKAVGEIVDMGFTAEQATQALTENGSGINVQAAVGWLLNEAHRKTQSRNTDRAGGASNAASRNNSRPREARDVSAQRRSDNRSPAISEDLSKTAAAVGSNIFKTANSLWKTSQKKVQQAVAEFQQEPDHSQPKWMRDTTPERQRPAEKSRPITREGVREGRPSSSRPAPEVTDEAMMLEAGGRPAPKRTVQPSSSRSQPTTAMPSRDSSPPVSRPSTGRSTPAPKWQQSSQSNIPDPRSRLSKQAIEDEAAQAYVSSARRRKPTTQPKQAEEPDLLFESAKASHQAASTNPFAQPSRPQPMATPVATPVSKPSRPSQPSTPIPVRPKAPSRSIPPVSTIALASSAQHRQAGTDHFKRGDYASAHSSYSSSLSALPPTHPLTIIILCNRSLTAIKTGDPKAAVNDADQALGLIGPSHGDNETINVGSGPGEGEKSMKEFYGKALMRKAEALEQMERWADAGAVWRLTVEAGVGGATAIQGRQRCEKALAPKAPPKPKAVAKPRPPLSAMADLGGQDTEAVKRLRLANAAAEKADDEKFALSDSVTLKLANWQNGRKDNLRALLGSLDSVLWEGSGWKKVGMHELVMNNKVKIIYMKAIAKVHPDKLPPNPPTEMKMLAEGIFATLNESWDSFKSQNDM